MTQPTLPAPLVPAEVDLRDFPFMPLHVVRLRDSDLASEETPEACWAAVLLWCASWHQLPAGSIPDSDQWQAKHTGYLAQGRISPGWKRVRDGALRGWVACSDGRLYHPVVAEQALSAWRGKLHQRWKSEAARIKKHNQRHELSGENAVQTPDFDAWIEAGCPQGHTLPVPGDKAGLSPGTTSPRPEDVPRETPSKRQRQGQGQGQGQGSISTTVVVGGAGGDEPSTTPPPAAPAPAARAAASTRGTRLPKDWALPKAWGEWALAEFPQWTAAKVRLEGERFRDHWAAKTGKDATKADWLATWRNWCRSDIAHRDDARTGAVQAVEQQADRKADETRAYLAEQARHAAAAVPPPPEVRQRIAELTGRLTAIPAAGGER